METQIHVTGYKELMGAMRILPDALQRRVLLKAGQKAMQPVKRKAKGNAQAVRDTGALARSLVLVGRRYTRTNTVWVGVGPDSKATFEGVRRGRTTAQKIKPAKYAHLVELGTSRTAAKPFLRPALESEAGAVGDILTTEVDKGLTREIARLPI